MSVVIETTLGDLTVDLFTDERPVACMNFVKLCQLKYYNFNLFHTVQQGFIAQTGDPSGAGDGGSSVWGVVEGSHKRFFEAEYIPKIYHSSAGILSLVSAGKNLVGSQFFFTLGENLTSLDGTHCVIGEVVEGHEVLRKLNDAIVDENFRPYQDIRITHTVVLEDPFPNPRGFQIPARSPSPSAERLKNGRIAADEDIDDTGGKSMEEMQELLAEREAKARATILEIVGDLPDADMAPPENVLFVCKLNPVTTDDDLEIIFSRFGVVKSCEVIRDRKTGDSLQYAFVEFEDQKSCEAAYFKMNNVLIDDRRIHVDFSQSISKVTWRGKGRGVDGDGGKLDFNNLKERNGNKPVNKHRNDYRRDRPDNDKDRGRMSSAERRKAREQRHQEQEEQRSKKTQSARSRSRDRTDRNRDKDRDRRTSRSREQTNRRRSPSRQRNDRRRTRSRERNDRRKSPARERNERRKSVSRERIDRRKSPARERNERRKSPARIQDDRRRATSPYRDGGNRYSPDRRHQESRRSSKDREQRFTLHSKENSQIDKRNRDSKEDQSRYRSKDHKIVEKESKHKKKSKRARSSSSSETSDSSEDSDSSSDSSDDSSEDSTSSEERKRRKNKKSKLKKSKAKSKHKSKKKHKK